MASQSQRGGSSWARYMAQPAFRYGWQSIMNREPFLDDVAFKVWKIVDNSGHAQRQYEAGRLMALETGMPLPPKAARITAHIKTAVAAAPELRRQFATEQALARDEAKRAAALRLKVRHYQKTEGAQA